jgi:hypothetical protein
MHGHTLLIDYLTLNDIQFNILQEIGTTRERTLSQNSSILLKEFANSKNAKFITIDMDFENTENFIKEVGKNDTLFEAITKKGEDYLRDYNKMIEVIYLDAFDFYHNGHSEKRKNKYKDILNTTITNENAHKMHLECAIEIVKKSKVGTIVCFDDILNKNTFEGKGKTAIPFLMRNGFEIQQYKPNAMILKRVK